MARHALAFLMIFPAAFVFATAAHAEVRTVSDKEAVAEAVCGDIMGLFSGEPYYLRCRQAIGDMLSDNAKRAQIATAYADCKERGFAGGSNEISACMLGSTAEAEPQRPFTIVVPGGPDTKPGKPFDYTASGVQRARERYACSQLGHMPGTPSFDGCVVGLKESVLPNKW